MKSFYIIVFLSSFPVNIVTLQPNLIHQGIPLINHYGPPYLLPTLFSYQHKKQDIVNAPHELQKSLPKDKALDLKIYSIIWQKDQAEAWPKDRTYNFIYHQIAKKWLESNPPPGFNPENFSINIPMGIFSAYGLQDLNHSGSSIPFEKLEERNVHMHDQAYSPNNANFKIQEGRFIAHFWTLAVSPDKKRAIVINNVIVNNDGIENLLQAKLTGNLNEIIKALKETISFLNSKKRQNDSQALNKFLASISKT